MAGYAQYIVARDHAIRGLTHDLECHEAGDYRSIGRDYDEYDQMLPREGIESDDPLMVALDFWASWTDTAIHNWKYYPGFTKDDWPRLARLLLEDLKAHRRVSDAVLLSNFGPKPIPPRVGMFAWLRRLIGGE